LGDEEPLRGEVLEGEFGGTSLGALFCSAHAVVGYRRSLGWC
jgi:hypothetical protein